MPLSIKDAKKVKDEIVDQSKINSPKAGFVRIVTSIYKGAGADRHKVFKFVDIPLKVKTGSDGNYVKDNTAVIVRYYRKWEAKKKHYCENNIEDIIPCPDYKPPKFSEAMLRNGKEDD